jgi:hypothetical protein
MPVLKKVMCPFDGIWYYNIPGVDRSRKPLMCPVCGGEQVIGAGPDMTAGGRDLWVHKEIEREFITTEEAVEIFKKYCRTPHFNRSYEAGKELFEDAWYSQHWPSGDYGYKRYDWMCDDLVLAFNWYLDAVGRDLGLGHGRAKGLLSRSEIDAIEKELNDYTRDRLSKKWEQQRKSLEKREKKLTKQGDEFTAQMKEGDVWMVKFNNIWNERGIQVLEIEPEEISGFYLDRDTKEVFNDTPEKPGYYYTKSGSIHIWPKPFTSYEDVKPGKLEWDGKTFIKTRTYETKMTKFLKRKIENPIIKKLK